MAEEIDKHRIFLSSLTELQQLRSTQTLLFGDLAIIAKK